MYHTTITVNLVSLFRWQDSGWKKSPSQMKPDFTVRIATSECMDAHKRITLNMSVKDIELHSELADESIKDKLANAVVARCQKDFKVIDLFGGQLRNGVVRRKGSMGSGNMFTETNYMVNFQHVYTFVVALDVADGVVNGVYLVPSSIPAPVDKAYDEDPFYKMCCYERF